MNNAWAIYKRELGSYFSTPIAYVLLVVFLLLNGIFTFYLGDFFTRSQADMIAFFSFHPWLYAFFVPAVAMRLWSEERRSGTIELLFTMPITVWQAVIGKYAAAFVFIAIALALTCPLWISVNYLGNPDNGVIVASYIGSLFMAGGYLAIGAAVSSITKNQVVAFVLTVLLCLSMNLLAWLPQTLPDVFRSFSFLSSFEGISRGLLDIKTLVYFSTLVLFALFANAVVLDMKKAD